MCSFVVNGKLKGGLMTKLTIVFDLIGGAFMLLIIALIAIPMLTF
jgi:hypothetical protein